MDEHEHRLLKELLSLGNLESLVKLKADLEVRVGHLEKKVACLEILTTSFKGQLRFILSILGFGQCE